MTHATTSSERVAGLILFHNKRIEQYKKALHDFNKPELDIKSIFERIIELSMKCRDQLVEKQHLKSGEVNVKDHGDFLPVPLDDSQKEILAACLRDELDLLNAYSIALSFTPGQGLKKLLQAQQQEIQDLHTHIKKYHDAR